MNCIEKCKQYFKKNGNSILFRICLEIIPPLILAIMLNKWDWFKIGFSGYYIFIYSSWAIVLRAIHLSETKSSLKGLIEKLELQTKDLIGYSIGLDSYASVIPAFHNVVTHQKTHSFVNFSVAHNGHYPLLDVNVSFRNNADGTIKEFTYASIVKNTSHAILNFEIIPGKEYFYTIHFYSRNGSITQLLKFIDISGDFHFVYLIRNQEKEIAFYNDPAYPNINGDNPREIFET